MEQSMIGADRPSVAGLSVTGVLSDLSEVAVELSAINLLLLLLLFRFFQKTPVL